MNDFFVSYNKADRQWAEWIAWTLEKNGYSTLIQEWDFRPGCNFILEMDRATKETERTILLLSPDFLSSDFTAAEWAAAFVEDPTGNRAKLLPIKVRDCRLHGLLASINYINLVGLSESDAKQLLLNGLSSERSKPKSQPEFPGQNSISSKPFYPGELPERAYLPSGSRIPFPPNAVFTGRENDLKELAATLLPSDEKIGSIQQATVITGSGGLGKTQLAIEFCYRFGRFFKGVHWIHAGNDISTEIAACGRSMVLPNWPDELHEQIALTLKTWQLEGSHLLIIDNVPGPSTIQEWMPQLFSCQLLITSLLPEWPPDLGLNTWPLSVLSRPKSIELLRRIAPRLNNATDNDLNNLSNRLGDLPLALDLSGRYLADRRSLSIEDYLTALEEAGNALEHTSLDSWVKYSPTGHATSLAATFSLSWDLLEEDAKDQVSRRIFKECGYCASNTSIPRDLLRMTVDSDELLDEALNRLSKLGLIVLANSGPSLHPLLAEFARLKDTEIEELIIVSERLGYLSERVTKLGLPEYMRHLREHLKTVAKFAEAAGLQKAGLLWNELGCHLRVDSEYEDARKCSARALLVDRKFCGSNHPTIANRFSNLGLDLKYLGNPQSAKKCHLRAAKIEEENNGKHSPQLAVYLNNLGGDLEDLGERTGSKRCYLRALEIGEVAYGLTNHHVATYASNLGRLLGNEGDLLGAKKFLVKALRIDFKVYGPNHPVVAKRLNNLGTILLQLIYPLAAKRLFLKALQMNLKYYGPDHYEVGLNLLNLGEVQKILGEEAEAKISTEKAQDIIKKHYGDRYLEVTRKNQLLLFKTI